jgi:hypothetical protein
VQCGSWTVRISNFKAEPLKLNVRALTPMSNEIRFNCKGQSFTDESQRPNATVPGSDAERLILIDEVLRLTVEPRNLNLHLCNLNSRQMLGPDKANFSEIGNRNLWSGFWYCLWLAGLLKSLPQLVGHRL